MKRFKYLIQEYGIFLEFLIVDANICVDFINILKNLTSLKHVQIFNVRDELVVKSLCDLPTIEDLKLEYPKLNDDHINIIKDLIKSLHSFYISTTLNVNKSVNDLLNHIKLYKNSHTRNRSHNFNLI